MHIKVTHQLALALIGGVVAFCAADPLASWNDGAAKKAITDFVVKVTTEGSPDFVKPAERIAVFDNDGTLWCEQPIYFQLAFAIDRVKARTSASWTKRWTNPRRTVGPVVDMKSDWNRVFAFEE